VCCQPSTTISMASATKHVEEKKHRPRRRKSPLIPRQEGLKSGHLTQTLMVWMPSAEEVKLNSLYGQTKENQTFLKMPFI